MSSLEPLIREFIVGGPMGKLLGMSVEALEPERVAVRGCWGCYGGLRAKEAGPIMSPPLSVNKKNRTNLSSVSVPSGRRR